MTEKERKKHPKFSTHLHFNNKYILVANKNLKIACLIKLSHKDYVYNKNLKVRKKLKNCYVFNS